MPQLDSSFFLSQVIWLTISFGLLYYFFDQYIYSKINNIVSKREEKIQLDLLNAEEMKKSIKILTENYKNKIVNARNKSRKIYEENELAIKQLSESLNKELGDSINALHLQAEEVIEQTKINYYKEINQAALNHASKILEIFTKKNISPEQLTKYLPENYGSRNILA